MSTLSSHSDDLHLVGDSHGTFPFLLLPAEIRNAVYKLVLETSSSNDSLETASSDDSSETASSNGLSCADNLEVGNQDTPTVAPLHRPIFFFFQAPADMKRDKQDNDLTGSSESHEGGTTNALLLVNQQLHAEAAAALYGSRPVIVCFPATFTEEEMHGRPTPASGKRYMCGLGVLHAMRRRRARERRLTLPKNTRQLGLTALPYVRHLVLDVRLLRRQGGLNKADGGNPTLPAAPATRVRRELQALVNAILASWDPDSSSSRTCEVRFRSIENRGWSAGTTSPPRGVERDDFFLNRPEHRSDRLDKHESPGPSSGGNVHDLFVCCGFGPKDAFGRKSLEPAELERLCRLSVAADQTVLEPLAQLRGLFAKVTVRGRVTDAWADYLTACMERDKADPPQPFEHAVPWP